ncbi:MAG: putative selenate reductase subunit YgfK [Spirochaeta sp.]|nr:putative selenate reductase subunit YgfK [Spirochaeta sp.]
MGDLMRPIPFRELLRRVFSEYSKTESIFGIHKNEFFRKESGKVIEVFGEECAVPLGPAAGPHTQLAQNIITSYLTGGRFIELKTVQKLDRLEIEKPCIDAGDEGYNTEWSTEYTLEKACDEYLKAWVILHLLEELLALSSSSGRSFIFNMSVGYDLEGIKSPGMQTFIDNLIDSSKNNLFNNYLEQLAGIIKRREYIGGTDLAGRLEGAEGLSSRISANICRSLTLSTMHGCPPDEIEAICSYMLAEKKLNTFVKLNPTLLGYERVRSILDATGFGYIELSRESFVKDLQYGDALSMLQRLTGTAKACGMNFGVKLSNTLGVVNNKAYLPGEEMYMSGRALFPLTINLAADIAADFAGQLPISYSGGASVFNVERIFRTGIRPITVATDLLKPGGYLRLGQMAGLLEKLAAWPDRNIDVEMVRSLAEEALRLNYTQKSWRGIERISIDEALPLTDCYAAPCKTACPINQDIPEYIRLVGEKRYGEALKLIYTRNALPAITGHICDHQCQYNCTRLDYEGSVKIRELKRIAVDNGYRDFKAQLRQPAVRSRVKICIVGAGPAGLAAAFFLAGEGFPVTVMEKEETAGGVVRHVLPRFRIPEKAILHDISFVEAGGVEFRYGISPDLSIDELKSEGFNHICLAIGAEKGNKLPLAGDNSRVIESLDFLRDFEGYPGSPGTPASPGKRVAVVGGGNTAMDSARAALKTGGVERVTVVYRRTEREMPADREEYEQAKAEGIDFLFLHNPEKFTEEGKLYLRRMRLGEVDESGRRRPLPTEQVTEIRVDTLISAIGEHVDLEILAALGIETDDRGGVLVDPDTLETNLENVYLLGDARTGPSTIVECIAEGRRVADAVCRKEYPGRQRAEVAGAIGAAGKAGPVAARMSSQELRALQARRAIKAAAGPGTGDEEIGVLEAARCLECSYLCNKCVEVCPNRANVAIPVGGGSGFLRDAFQIVHLDGACNECGNCGRFCPWDGLPYKDKFTLFSLEEDFRNSEAVGFMVETSNGKKTLAVRLAGEVFKLEPGELIPWAGQDDLRKKIKNIMEVIIRDHDYLLGAVEH